ncbi:MAG: rhodanese-like domain-containing protein [Flavobacteriales bacterium]|nr:rhodanese-like domain-containing protein [Flavobacteriales bacterium]
MRIIRLHHLLPILLLSFSACAQNTDLDREVKKLYRNTVPVLQPAQVNGRKVVLDTRERQEFDVSHLPRARWVGYDDFDMCRVANIAKSDTIIVYCSIGYRSERVGEKLVKAGYVHVFNLYGGIFQWKNSGGVVVDAKNDTTQRVHCYDRSWSRFLLKGEKVF